jgi:hypothetical protein
MRLRFGGRVEPIEFADEGERIGEVVASERAQLDAGRARYRETPDRPVGIAERHALSAP